jgi:hypothetical protein
MTVTNHTKGSGARQLTAKCRWHHQRGGVERSKELVRRCLTLRFSGRERHNEAMRTVRSALRCNRLLDSASFSSPPRPTAAPSNRVANLTRCAGARQLAAMSRWPHQRGGVVHSRILVRRCLTLPISGRGNGHGRSVRTLLPALRCIGLLDSASFRTPPRHTCRAFIVPVKSYSLRLSAATHRDERTALQARRRRTPRGPRTPMSNAPHHRATERHWKEPYELRFGGSGACDCSASTLSRTNFNHNT